MKDQSVIKIYGAREHNLKNVSVTIPKNKFVVITGPSGSGKSSLAMDTLYAEGKRRYVESLSAYARQFLGIEKRPSVDKIEGLCPAIAIEQKTVGHNPRSTVGTTTEIYDYLRVLFARVGEPHCPECGVAISEESPERVTEMLLKKLAGKSVVLAAPIAREKKGEFKNDLIGFFQKGFIRFSIDGETHRFQSEDEIKDLKLDKKKKHTIDLLIDSLVVSDEERSRLQEGIERALKLAGGLCKIIDDQGAEQVFSALRMCVACARSFAELEPRFFSFNSPIGACQECHGLGMMQRWPWQEGDHDFWKTQYSYFSRFATEVTCESCQGQRLNQEALSVTIGGKNIADVSALSIEDLTHFLKTVQLTPDQQSIGQGVITEIINRLEFLINVGLSYLTLSRTARTLSGGESQRIRLATQLGSALSGVMYILDEPSIGLHQRDNDRLIQTLKNLRDHGNTVIVVEHDIETIMQADYLVDVGPQAGYLGGRVTACGTPQELAHNENSLTGSYVSGKRTISVPQTRRKPTSFLTLKGARLHNLKNIDVKFPLGVLCGISGVSGSGKSSLVMQTLIPAAQTLFHRGHPLAPHYDKLKGIENVHNLVHVDQSPIGRTPRSNPATYLGIFNDIRALFASVPESKARGYEQGQFSFNVPAGRCFECRGDGIIKVSMHFLEDVEMECKACKGSRYNKQTLEILYKGKNIADILAMTAHEARSFFEHFSRIKKRLDLLCDVGLDYLKLGQPSTTLSGGEAQRIKLVNELSKRGQGTLYILDEPTTGLHNIDVERLLSVLNHLVDKGNTVLVIEHNLDVLKSCDYLIDIGPEGGNKGGELIAHGTPEDVAKASLSSYTAQYLKELLR